MSPLTARVPSILSTLVPTRRRRAATGDLAALSVDAGLASATGYQREAADLLEQARMLAGPQGFTVSTRGVALDGLDLVVGEAVKSGGAALAFVDLLSLAKAPDDRERSFSVPVDLPEIHVAAHALRRQGNRVTVTGPRARSAIIREPAYRLRAHARYVGAWGRPGAVWDALVVVQVPAHLAHVSALATRLHESEGLRVGFLAADARMAELVGDAGFEVVGGPSWDPAGTAAALSAAVRVRRRVRSAIRELGGSARIEAFGHAVDRVIANRLTSALLLARWAAPIIDPARLHLVITPNPVSFVGRVTCRIAEARRVPVLALQHGAIGPDDPQWRSLPVTTVCVWGEPSGRALITSGVTAGQVVVTGAPQYDGGDDVVAPGASAASQPASSTRALVATSGPGDHTSLDEHLRFIRILEEVVDRAPDVEWTVRLHLKDRPEYYEALGSRPGVTVLPSDRARHTSIIDDLARATCLVTIASATALDALRSGTPVLCVWVTADHEPPEYVRRPSAVVVHDADGLVAALAAAAEGTLDAPDPAYLDEHFAHRGEAMDRVVAEATRLIGGTRTSG